MQSTTQSPPWPYTLQEINDLPEPQKLAIYRTLIPDWLFLRYHIDRETVSVDGRRVVEFRCPAGSRALELTVWHRPEAQDPLLYLHMADSFNSQITVLLLIINDPCAPRFNIDVDEQGRSTELGTAGRNLEEERRAMEHGLAPGQIRAGLRSFRGELPNFERFVSRMGHDLFMIEPLTYHNAIMFESFGFSYMRGRQVMESIHAGFQPGGTLHHCMNGSTPFRTPDGWKTVRGRSWAIHDGILTRPFTGIQMYKRVGHDAGVNTFPNAVW